MDNPLENSDIVVLHLPQGYEGALTYSVTFPDGKIERTTVYTETSFYRETDDNGELHGTYYGFAYDFIGIDEDGRQEYQLRVP